MSDLPADYAQRVYAGVLGKLIGVYLGRPFEQWRHERIMRELGPIEGYQHEKLGVPLVVTDDDISGTFSFIRALSDHPAGRNITSREIGQTWLNYIAENRHILWWGGMGLSTEHTAFLRLKRGIEAPRSGSIELNGRAVAEEIGAQIFIDGWAMIAPGQPELAAHLAAQAARVSHDGEAVHAAQLLAVMESMAFVEPDIDRLLDHGLRHIPAGSELSRMVRQIRSWCSEDRDWQETFKRIQQDYSYQRYGTNCPVMSNHALIILGLLHGQGDFDRSMMIINTCGWDTDCNAGNLGCLLGIRNGLECFTRGYDWQGPVNDRALIGAADGHRGVTDAAALALELVNLGRGLADLPPVIPKDGAAFHFSLPGSTQGFASDGVRVRPVITPQADKVEGGLRIELLNEDWTAVRTPVFIDEHGLGKGSYGLAALPRVYAGQRAYARLIMPPGAAREVQVALAVSAYGDNDALQEACSESLTLQPGQDRTVRWTIPALGNWPIVRLGINARGGAGASFILDRMGWEGIPSCTFDPPVRRTGRWAAAWERSWVGSMHHFHHRGGMGAGGPFDLAHDEGRGLLHTGAADWQDYRVQADAMPWLSSEFGLAIRVRGLMRYYAVLAAGGELRLLCVNHSQRVLASTPWDFEYGRNYRLHLDAQGSRITGGIEGGPVLSASDDSIPSGGIGLIVADGRVVFGAVTTRETTA